jgi:CCR4-NOT transcription complex subunit 9
MSDEKPFEYLRLTSLGVIGALVKVDDSEVINFLLQTEIIPLCLRIMETGTELSKTVATFIVQKILLDDAGLQYVCATGERFYAVSQVLSSMVGKLLEGPSIRLLKHIVRCYLRLSEHAKARDALRQCLPAALRDQSFMNVFKSDESVQLLYYQMLKNLSTNESGETLPSNVGDSDAEEGFGVLDAQQQQLLQQQQGGVLPSSLFSPQEALGGIGLSPFYEHKPEVTAIKEDAVAEFK